MMVCEPSRRVSNSGRFLDGEDSIVDSVWMTGSVGLLSVSGLLQLPIPDPR